MGTPNIIHSHFGRSRSSLANKVFFFRFPTTIIIILVVTLTGRDHTQYIYIYYIYIYYVNSIHIYHYAWIYLRIYSTMKGLVDPSKSGWKGSSLPRYLCLVAVPQPLGTSRGEVSQLSIKQKWKSYQLKLCKNWREFLECNPPLPPRNKAFIRPFWRDHSVSWSYNNALLLGGVGRHSWNVPWKFSWYFPTRHLLHFLCFLRSEMPPWCRQLRWESHKFWDNINQPGVHWILSYYWYILGIQSPSENGKGT